MRPSGHVDTFARDNLPPREAWPDLLVGQGDFAYPDRLNCVERLLDRWIAAGEGARPCIFSPAESWTYADLFERVNRIANVLTHDLELVAGNRVLLRAPNTPMLVACYLAVMKAGLVAVATMPLMRAKELALPLDKAKIGVALCDSRLVAELEVAGRCAAQPLRIVRFGSPGDDLETMMAQASPDFAACDTAQDDVCLFGFTSGTTGGPKATMHFHRDVMAISDGYAKHILAPTREDRFIGSPPLAFTFGLGGLVVFPFAVGASTVLLEKAPPEEMLAAIRRFRPTILFTAPTAYRAMSALVTRDDVASLRICVSAGEGLPKATFERWLDATGLPLMDGIGATEMLHIFIASPPGAVRPGATGVPVPGYDAKIVDAHGLDVLDGTPGLLAVRGPTGCRYLADERQARYVRGGWNYTGDTYIRDADGYFWYQARADDMIISAGYNISGPEVEEAIAAHPAVAECAVIGAPDAERGQIVEAHVVLRAGVEPSDALVRDIQDFVKARIAPYKYPRAVKFDSELPKTANGKLQRSALRAATRA